MSTTGTSYPVGGDERIQSAMGAAESRALKLLGSGCTPEVTATATGISVSRVSQLLSDPNFAAKVAELRFASVEKHSDRDQKYDDIEDQLVGMLKDVLPFLMKPMEIIRAIQTINGLKRRGSSAVEAIQNQQTVVSLLMPVQIVQKFTTNINNQVIQAGSQTLETVQSGSLLQAAKNKQDGLHAQLPTYTRQGELSSPLSEYITPAVSAGESRVLIEAITARAEQSQSDGTT